MGDVPTYYRPRMVAKIEVPLLGTREERINQAASKESFILMLNPHSCRIESNDHNHADSCDVVVDWTEAGVDPRLLDNAVLTVWMANADDQGVWADGIRLPLDDKNIRFIGLTKEIEAKRDTSNAAEVRFACVDYTTLFIEAKPFGSSGIPSYDQDLQDAWRRICSQTPGAGALADKLEFEGFATAPVLGKAVGDRFKKLGKVPVHPDTDAWAVWQQCVGMLGLISFIRLDKCIVTTATNLYTESHSPLMIWGQNLEEWSEVRHSAIVGKGIGVSSFDPISQTTLEAFWPPVGDKTVARKRPNAVVSKKKPQSEGNTRANEERDYFPIPGVTNQAALLDIAKRIYEERSRQELEGHFRTREMFVQTQTDPPSAPPSFDMLGLRSGDTVSVTLNPGQAETLASLPSDDARLQFLEERGYAKDIAKFIIKNMQDFDRLDSKFLVHSVTTELSLSEKSGTFSIECHYINRINIDGSASGGTAQDLFDYVTGSHPGYAGAKK
jgi:hypothetical protein